ncbi:PEP-CTERM sorting domain-containing protein [Rubrivivax albus]|uniref:PEP-CTERM sorting domain-containing protein n=1 Tax=Rubrivivax albus TaxID=2499835 RepID=A0A437JUK0_9BURK|nr:PEP-CTERM sorting domain-containing protein [Rubrivivax albus]RVT50912.1 PEP-CTERM sorting domain-containing protein [Rubrivivax albus]
MLSRRTLVLAAILLPGMAANAALEARDLDGEASTAEAWYDTLLDITWLADANHAHTSGAHLADGGRMTWAQASGWVAGLSFTHPDTGQAIDGWRLPQSQPLDGVAFNLAYRPDGSSDFGWNIANAGTVNAGSTAHELAHLYYVTLGHTQAYLSPDGAPSGCTHRLGRPDSCLQHTGPFVNVGADGLGVYWQAHDFGPLLGAAVFAMADGGEGRDVPASLYAAWAVHPGDVAAPVPEPGTWALWGAGLVALARVRRPSRWRS